VKRDGILSPFLFGIFIDDLAKLIKKAKVDCRVGGSCTAVFLYADDVILLAPSVDALQTLLVNMCATELEYLDVNSHVCVLVPGLRIIVPILQYLIYVLSG